MAAILVKVEAKTVAKTLHYVEVNAVVDMHPDKLSVVVPKAIADARTRLRVEAPVKTEAGTLAGVKIFPSLDTLNKVETEAVVNTPACTFRQVQAKSVTSTLRDLKAETPVDLSLTKARVISVTPGDTMGNVECKVLF